MKEIYINCSCGGGASVKIAAESTTACTECACGKILLWGATDEIADAAMYKICDEMLPGSVKWVENPPTLGISVGDDVKTEEKFGA